MQASIQTGHACGAPSWTWTVLSTKAISEQVEGGRSSLLDFLYLINGIDAGPMTIK
jgi:hypothetical protein